MAHYPFLVLRNTWLCIGLSVLVLMYHMSKKKKSSRDCPKCKLKVKSSAKRWRKWILEKNLLLVLYFKYGSKGHFCIFKIEYLEVWRIGKIWTTDTVLRHQNPLGSPNLIIGYEFYQRV